MIGKEARVGWIENSTKMRNKTEAWLCGFIIGFMSLMLMFLFTAIISMSG